MCARQPCRRRRSALMSRSFYRYCRRRPRSRAHVCSRASVRARVGAAEVGRRQRKFQKAPEAHLQRVGRNGHAPSDCWSWAAEQTRALTVAGRGLGAAAYAHAKGAAQTVTAAATAVKGSEFKV